VPPSPGSGPPGASRQAPAHGTRATRARDRFEAKIARRRYYAVGGRWSFGRFLFIALGGIIPLLSFFFEFRVPRWVREAIAAAQPAAETPVEAQA